MMKNLFAALVFPIFILTAQPGRMDTLRIPGRPANEDRVFVWIPAQGVEKVQHVLYMNDGQNLFDSSTTWNGRAWMVRESLDSLISNGYIPPILLVAIPNSDIRHSEYTPEKPFRSLPAEVQQYYRTAVRPNGTSYYRADVVGDSYLQYVTQRVKPEIERQYLKNKTSIKAYIAGASMGGLIAWYAVLRYPDAFDGAACFATHWPLIQEIPSAAGEGFISYFHQRFHSVKEKRWYFDYGDRGIDTLYGPYQQVVDRLFKSNHIGNTYKSLFFPVHDHNEIYWKMRFPAAIRFLVN
ncbi:MAG: alpha/beta hydrolase [Thermaurantimonas sp.]